jgi:hypothetical protein
MPSPASRQIREHARRVHRSAAAPLGATPHQPDIVIRSMTELAELLVDGRAG